MRLAICGWVTDSGLGSEARDAMIHLPVMAAFVLPNPMKPTRNSYLTVPFEKSRGGVSGVKQMNSFIDRFKPDTILTWELPGDWAFPRLWRQRGLRWIHVVHWDWYDARRKNIWRMADKLIAPNVLCYRKLKAEGFDSVFLPIPIDTNVFPFRLRKTADRFLSVVGFGGYAGRRGLGEIVAAWKSMAEPPDLLLPSQRDPRKSEYKPTPGIKSVVKNLTHPANLYVAGDVAVQPSRFEGVGLTLLEAQACGLPVITVDAEPMRDLAPDLLVPLRRTGSITISGKDVESHIVDPDALARLVTSLRGSDIEELSRRARDRVTTIYSWQALGDQWLEVLGG